MKTIILDGLKIPPRRDVEQTKATRHNNESRQRVWGQAKGTLILVIE